MRCGLNILLLLVAPTATAQAQKSGSKPRTPVPARARAVAPPDGQRIYSSTCAACHQANGEGIEEKYPPLAMSELVADEPRLIRVILHGLNGPVEVAGQTYDGAMPPWGSALKDAEIAAVATYVRGMWGNKSPASTVASVTAIRAATTARKRPFTAAELARAASTR